MDFNRRYYDTSNNSSYNGIHRNLMDESSSNKTDISFRTATESPMHKDESARYFSAQDLQRRNTVAGADSPFSTRRRVMLQSTPIAARTATPSAYPAQPNFDLSAITTATENEENKQRALEDRTSVPHFFGSAFVEKPRPPINDSNNKFLINDNNSTIKTPTIPTLTNFSPSCSRSNTFAGRKDYGGNRFSPYSLKNEKNLPKGPPLRSLHDSSPLIKRKTNESSPIHVEPPSHEERDYWVTVFGFDKQKGVDPILELFGRHGQIVKSARAANDDANWIHLRYSSKTHVDQALQRNGQMIENCFIGVIQSPNIPYGTESNKWHFATPTMNYSPTNQTPIESASPQTPTRFIPGMRSLAVPSPNAPAPKGNSLINFLFKGKNFA